MTKEISEEEYLALQKRIQQNMIDWLQPYMEKITNPEKDESGLRNYFAASIAGDCFKEAVAKYGWGNCDAVYTETACMARRIADSLITELK